MRTYANVHLCTDCHLAAHGYDEKETGRPMPKVSHRFTDNSFCNPKEEDELHPGEVCEGECHTSFSWMPCDNPQCLDPQLGGDRYRYAEWYDDKEMA